jgi:ABC-type branched-subunit amino acid transport system substrate-binding protein
VIVFVGIPPTALQNFIKQKNELGLNVPIIDAAGILPGAGALKALGQNAEGVYTFATLFDLGKTGKSLQKDLINRKLDRTYSVAYGYDTIKYIIEGIVASKETGKSIIESLANETKFDGLAGTYTFYGKNNEDIQPVVIPVQVVNGTFKEVLN